VQATDIQWHKAARRSAGGEVPCGTDHGLALHHAQGLGRSPQTDSRQPVSARVYGGAAVDQRALATSRARSRVPIAKCFDVALFDCCFLQKVELKCTTV
jgi:hypothetical protein